MTLISSIEDAAKMLNMRRVIGRLESLYNDLVVGSAV